MKPLSRDEWIAIRRSGDAAILASLDDVLLPYQQRADALLESASVLVIEKSRRIGMTYGLACTAVLRAARQKAAGGMDVLYISYAQEMTREFIDACGTWARALAIGATAEDEMMFDDTDPAHPEETRQIAAFRIRFASGYEIVALSSAPRSLRGKQGLCIIDEAAFVDSLPELLKAAMSFLIWGGKVAVLSTHNGAANPFNELVQDCLSGRKPYRHMRVDFDLALKEGLYQRICRVNGKAWSPEAEADWRDEVIASVTGVEEELFCIPSESDGVWLSTALIEARMNEDGEILRFELPADYLSLEPAHRLGLVEAAERQMIAALAQLDRDDIHGVGFDFARHMDLSVATVLALGKALRKRERLSIELRRWPYREQAALLIRLIKWLPRWQAVIMDATGSGEAVAEEVMRACGDKIVPLKLTQEWYRLNMPMVKRDFEDGAISLVRDREHREDLRLVKIVRGIPVIPEVRSSDGKGNKRHGDFAVSLALAHAALRTDPVVMSYQPVPSAAHPLFGDGGSRRDWRYPDHDEDRRMTEGSLRGSI